MIFMACGDHTGPTYIERVCVGVMVLCVCVCIEVRVANPNEIN